MNVSIRRAIATTELLLIFPAAVFMTAIFVRNVTPLPKEPAYTAHRIVLWFAAQGLWGLLVSMPLAVLVIGTLALVWLWNHDAQLRLSADIVFNAIRAHLTTALIAMATLASAGVLAFIGVHMLTD